VIEALSAARVAHEAATRALLRAEDAARAAGVAAGLSTIDELTVKRINVVEDDGTLRIVIGNSTHGRTIPVRGRLVEHPGRAAAAGLLFMNDEGTECGGLEYRGRRGPEGREQSGYLTVDDFEQNESLRFGMTQDGAASRKFLEFHDRPDWSFVDLIDETSGLDDAAARAVHEGTPAERAASPGCASPARRTARSGWFSATARAATAFALSYRHRGIRWSRWSPSTAPSRRCSEPGTSRVPPRRRREESDQEGGGVGARIHS
jgi:hypothetical protein